MQNKQKIKKGKAYKNRLYEKERKMNKNQKRWMILVGIIVVLIIVLAIVFSTRGGNDNEVVQGERGQNEEIYVTELEDGTKLNTSEEFNNEKRYGNLVIRNMQYTEQNGMTVMLAEVTNEGSTVHEPEIVTITIYGENNEVITDMHPVIGRIEPGETIKINASTTADVANAKDYEIIGEE